MLLSEAQREGGGLCLRPMGKEGIERGFLGWTLGLKNAWIGEILPPLMFGQSDKANHKSMVFFSN